MHVPAPVAVASFCLLALSPVMAAAQSNVAGSAAPTPPAAERRPHVDTLHGDVRQDDWFWLRASISSYSDACNGFVGASTCSA